MLCYENALQSIIESYGTKHLLTMVLERSMRVGLLWCREWGLRNGDGTLTVCKNPKIFGLAMALK